MRTIHATAITAAALLALAACNSDSDPKPPRATRTPSAATTEPAPSKAEMTAQCTAAVAALPPGPDGVPFTPTPPPCAGLSDHEYLNAYMDGIAQANQNGRDALTAGSDAGQ